MMSGSAGHTLAALMLAAICAVCFVAIKAGLAFAPPLLFAGLRAEIAGVALLGLVVLRRPAAPPETGDIVLMRSDTADVLAAIGLSNATLTEMKQKLFWAAAYNLIAIPIAAGALYPALGLMLRPEFGALAMSASSITVVSNALRLRRTRLGL